MAAATHVLTLPGPMLVRGFWLYVWRVETPKGEMLYVGRTGDNSSPHASAPYTRMGQHLGTTKTHNSLRKHLKKQGFEPEDCAAFHLVSYGPLHNEVDHTSGLNRAALMLAHTPLRNLVGALEKALADALREAGYAVLNTVKWNHPYQVEAWVATVDAFAEHFPKLNALKQKLAG
jgi:hypothetical protein